MKKTILHLDVASTVTDAHVLVLDNGRFSPVGRASCPTPTFSGNTDRAVGLAPVLDAIQSQVSKNGSSREIDRVLVTVSAGGEPKAVCAGVVKGISGESAKRAALAAGATVSDLVCVDDGRQDFERISDLRRQELSVAVMAGGVDEEIMSSGRHQILNVARILAAGLPKRRWSDERVPLVYAASQEVREEIARILGDTEIIWADNVRARLEEEHLDSAREAVAQVFARSVRSDPRFGGLGRFGLPDAFPSGYAAGLALEQLYAETGENLLALSLDCDAIQVFSVIKGVFTRTVTPITKVNSKKVARWLPRSDMGDDLGDIIGNLSLRPWVLPTSWDELAVFLAFWKEVIREGIAEHKSSAIELRGVHRQRQIGETFQVEVAGGDPLLKMPSLRRVIVTGALSHVLPGVALMSLIMDGLETVGVTAVYRDPLNFLQVAGLQSPGTVSLDQSLVPLGAIVAPGEDRDRVGTGWATLRNGKDEQLPVEPGGIVARSVESVLETEIELEPSRHEDLGEGLGRKAVRALPSGFANLYIDGRPRTQLRSLDKVSSQDIVRWYTGLGVFPDQVLSGWGRGTK